MRVNFDSKSCNLKEYVNSNTNHRSFDIYFLNFNLFISEIVRLILNYVFGHNLNFKFQNINCKPIFNIYASRPFKQYTLKQKPKFVIGPCDYFFGHKQHLQLKSL